MRSPTHTTTITIEATVATIDAINILHGDAATAIEGRLPGAEDCRREDCQLRGRQE